MRLTRGAADRAGRGPVGAYAIRIRQRADGSIEAEAWGPGAAWALDGLPGLVGEEDDAAGFQAGLHPVVARLAHRLPGLRLGRSRAMLEALVPAILEQKITGAEAGRAYRALTARFGEPAPGPLGLRLPPSPAILAGLPYHAFHPAGIEERRARLIRTVARDGGRLEALVSGAPETAETRLRTYPGIGPWTAAEVRLRALGDPDAVSVGDYHLPGLVGWALAGERRADDARMLELLEPWRGQRGRVLRLLEAGGVGPPRRGPRMPARSIGGL